MDREFDEDFLENLQERLETNHEWGWSWQTRADELDTENQDLIEKEHLQEYKIKDLQRAVKRKDVQLSDLHDEQFDLTLWLARAAHGTDHDCKHHRDDLGFGLPAIPAAMFTTRP